MAHLAQLAVCDSDTQSFRFKCLAATPACARLAIVHKHCSIPAKAETDSHLLSIGQKLLGFESLETGWDGWCCCLAPQVVEQPGESMGDPWGSLVGSHLNVCASFSFSRNDVAFCYMAPRSDAQKVDIFVDGSSA